jgi:hypothetical protein
MQSRYLHSSIVALALGVAAACAAAPKGPPARGHITIAGYVTDTASDGFVIDFDHLPIRIDMSAWRWEENYNAFAHKRVVVMAPLRSTDLEARSLAPDAVYVSGLDIYYERKADGSITSVVLHDPPESGFASVRATMRSRNERGVSLDGTVMAVDTSRLRATDTSALESGERVVVSGPVDAAFWTGRTLDAERIEPAATP